jgi:prepilin-type N-terminal cleavage/methylation domain-containing protein
VHPYSNLSFVGLHGRCCRNRQAARAIQTFRVRGFTLIEVLAVLIISVLLLILATPSVSHILLKARARAAHDRWLTSALFARSSALRNGQSTVLRPATPQGGWRAGWGVYACETGELLRVFSGTGSGVDIRATRGEFVFRASGLGQPNFGRIEIVSARRTHWTICISAGGRMRSVAGAKGCAH